MYMYTYPGQHHTSTGGIIQPHAVSIASFSRSVLLLLLLLLSTAYTPAGKLSNARCTHQYLELYFLYYDRLPRLPLLFLCPQCSLHLHR